MPNSEVVGKIKKYMDLLKREEKIGHALSRLEKIDMTLDLLQKTQVGKAVNQLVRHDIYGDDACRIVTSWKEIARLNGIIPVKEEPRSSSSSEAEEELSDSEKSERSSSPPPERSRTPSPAPVRALKRPKVEVKEEYASPPTVSTYAPMMSSSSSHKREKKVENVVVKKEHDAFSRMLATAAEDLPPKPKKAKPMDWSSDIDLNYRPLPTLKQKETITAAEQFNPEQMFRPRNDRAKVFAGRKKGAVITEVPKLFDLSMRVLGNNIHVIRSMGPSIPFFVLEPVLEKCSVKQLERIESMNPHLEEDSDKLWERFYNKAHPGVKKSKRETYKEAYFRKGKERDAKLLELSKKITKAKDFQGEHNHKTELIEEAYAPLHIRRKQARHGTALGNRVLPSASEVSKARKEIFDKGSSRSLSAIPSAVVNRFSSVGAHKNTSQSKPVVKKGALMMKTMKMLNMKKRR